MGCDPWVWEPGCNPPLIGRVSTGEDKAVSDDSGRSVRGPVLCWFWFGPEKAFCGMEGAFR